MTGFGTRIIVMAGRLCAWLVVGVPVVVVAVIAFAAMEVRDRPPDISYAAPVAMTISIAALSAGIGAVLGAALAFLSAEFGRPWLSRAVRLVIAGLRAIPPVVLGWLGWLIVIPRTFLTTGAHATQSSWQPVAVAVMMLALLVVAPAFGAVMHALARIPDVTRAAAASAGATRSRIALAVLLPLVTRTLWASIALGFARAAGEATAVWLIFFAGSVGQSPLAAFVIGASLHGVTAAGSTETLILLGQASAAGLVLTALGFGAVSMANRFDRNIAWA
jgi:ABC-type phosphate transport system permease subunit